MTGDDATRLPERLYAVLLVLGAIAAVGLAWVRAVAGPARLPPVFSSVLAAAVTCFGGIGLLTMHVIALPAGLTRPVAAIVSLLCVAALCGLARLARRDAEARHAYANLAGALADVVAPIRPGETGTVRTRTTHPALTLAAVARDDQCIGRGERVVVTRYRGDRAEVATMRAATTDNEVADESLVDRG